MMQSRNYYHLLTDSDKIIMRNIIRNHNLYKYLGRDWFNIVEGSDFDSDDACRERHSQFISNAMLRINSSKETEPPPCDWESQPMKEPEQMKPTPEEYRESLSPETKSVWEKIVSGDIDIELKNW
jgi:hypothetical protein